MPVRPQPGIQFRKKLTIMNSFKKEYIKTGKEEPNSPRLNEKKPCFSSEPCRHLAVKADTVNSENITTGPYLCLMRRPSRSKTSQVRNNRTFASVAKFDIGLARLPVPDHNRYRPIQLLCFAPDTHLVSSGRNTLDGKPAILIAYHSILVFDDDHPADISA